MNKSIYLLIFLCILIGGYIYPLITNDNDKLLAYTNKYEQYSIKYPNNLNISEFVYFSDKNGGTTDFDNGTKPINNCITLKNNNDSYLYIGAVASRDSACGAMPSGGFNYDKVEIISERQLITDKTSFTVNEKKYLFTSGENYVYLEAKNEIVYVSMMSRENEYPKKKDVVEKILISFDKK